MKQINKLSKTMLAVALIMCFFLPMTAKAGSDAPPTETWDWRWENNRTIYNEPFGFGGGYFGTTQYSSFKFEPYNSALSLKINAGSDGSPSSRISIACIDGRTNMTVETQYIYCTENQYVTFSNLPSSEYYFKLKGGSTTIMAYAEIYISKNNIFS